MARRTSPPGSSLTAAATPPPMQVEQVSGNRIPGLRAASYAAPVQVFKKKQASDPKDERNQIAKSWQIEAYRQVKICGEARYYVTLFSSMTGRAELGISEPQALRNRASWVESGPEVDALSELAPTVRERTKLIRDYMLHRIIAGECYLIARTRQPTDPGYIAPPEPDLTWDQWIESRVNVGIDPLDEDNLDGNPNEPIWEIVAVTELRKTGTEWSIRHDNGNYIALDSDDPVIRMWNPDPENRREAWSPLLSVLPTLHEIEWLTRHIFTQVKSRLMSAGVWFLPNNLTFPPPPSSQVEGGEEAIAAMNEAEKFMMSLAASSTVALDDDEVSFPSVVMADEAALATIDQAKLIQFWSTIDDKAMTLRSDAIRRFALGVDMPPEQILGSSGIAVSGTSGSAGSVNHWGEWAKEEQTIQNHIEPALDDFAGVLTDGVIRLAVPNTRLVVAYNTATLRSKQDRSKEAIELHGMGLLKGATTVREAGFDPMNDMMDEEEFKRWVLVKLIGGSPTPEQVAEAVKLLTNYFIPAETGGADTVGGTPGRSLPRNTDHIEVKGPPEGDHQHQDAPYAALVAASEVLVLRALEKAGNRLLNEGKRGRERDRTTPLHLAHTVTERKKTYIGVDFDFSLADEALPLAHHRVRTDVTRSLSQLCANLYNSGEPYTREALLKAVGVPE